MKKLVALMVALTMVLGLASVASAAEYPSKGISVICPWGAGGGTDAVLRAFCEAMGKDLGVTLTVDNRTGGGGIIGHQAIADAEPDGYTIGMITFELSTYKHLGTSELTYEDYEPLCRVNTDAAAITVNAEWAKANNITDLLRIDLHLDNLRCVFSDLSSWLIDCFGHNLIHDVKSCFSCLCNCLFNDGSCQSVNLDIHLDSCDTFMCSGYLEVHISEEVFQSLDICQYKVIIISITCYKSTGDSCYCRFDWYTCCHQSHRRCTYTCL